MSHSHTFASFLQMSNGNFLIQYPSRSHARIQPKFSKSMPFPCKNFTGLGVGRSRRRPTSVHQLRPGDVDVIAALGDSLVAGNGAMEEYALGTMIENRGVSWCIGNTQFFLSKYHQLFSKSIYANIFRIMT